jgi:hypothetical protein
MTKIWKQLKCPSTDEQVSKMWQTPLRKYYSALCRNKILIYAATWKNIEDLMLRSSINLLGKDKYCVISLI